MTQEEKAKAYDEALKRAKHALTTDMDDSGHWAVNYIFPELKESEDEKIRKAIISIVAFSPTAMFDKVSVSIEEALAWLEKQVSPQMVADAYLRGCNDTEKKLLEKQGEKKQDPCEHCKDKCLNCDNFPCIDKRMFEQGEQKPDDTYCKQHCKGYQETGKCFADGECKAKIDSKNSADYDKYFKDKPKFKVGDFILNCDVTDDGRQEIFKIQNVCSDWYNVENIYDGRRSILTFTQEWSCRLWNIGDAKDGDVLAEDSCIFIIERMKSNGTAIVYCCLFDDGDFDSGSTLGFDVDSTYPATKEQRDLLFKEMKKGGYRWDADKKELERIVIDEGKDEMDDCFTKMMNGEKVSPTWSEEDEKMKKEAISIIQSYMNVCDEAHDPCYTGKNVITWLENQGSISEHWTEEDEENLSRIIGVIERREMTSTVEQYKDILHTYVRWLKSLKRRLGGK